MSAVKISQINTLSPISKEDNVLLTGVKKNVLDDTFDNVNISLPDFTSSIASGFLTDNYNPDDTEKTLSSHGLKNSFLAASFDNTNDSQALSGKNLYFLSKSPTTFSVIFEKTNTDEFKFNIENIKQNDERFTRLSVTNGSDVLTSLNLEELTVLANYGFVSEVATQIDSASSSFIDDKINAKLNSSNSFIELTEDSICKNNNYYIASTESALYKSGIFDLRNISFGLNNMSISKSYILFVIVQDVTIRFPENLVWNNTNSLNQTPTFETGKRYLVEIINDGYGLVGNLIYGI